LQRLEFLTAGTTAKGQQPSALAALADRNAGGLLRADIAGDLLF
jgi:hypothetical protein